MRNPWRFRALTDHLDEWRAQVISYLALSGPVPTFLLVSLFENAWRERLPAEQVDR
jgi:hypothetical protein